MRKLITKYLINLAEKYVLISTSLNRILCIFHALDFHKIYSDKNVSFQEQPFQINKNPPPFREVRTNFMVRVILENNYKRVVEIGADNLHRSLFYKRVFPDIQIFALDIIPGFPTGVTDGIHTARFDLEWFTEHALPNTIITSSGTLSYFKPDELVEFFNHIYNLGYDIAFAELGSYFAKTKSLRRSVISYYHPYTYLLKKIGYKVNVKHPDAFLDSDPLHPEHAFSLSMMERGEYIFAKSITKH